MMEGLAQIVSASLVAVVILVLVQWRFHPLHAIPAVGPSAPLLSYLGAYRYLHHGPEVLQEGYNKYKVFKVAMLDRWVVIVSGSEMIEELRKIPDSHMSFIDAAQDFIQTKYTIAPDVTEHPIHLPVIRGPLTRNLGVLFGDVMDEISSAFRDIMPMKGDEWVTVSVIQAMAQIVARASNRIFVGVPLCRDPGYLNTVVNFTFGVAKGRFVLTLVPRALKSFVGYFLPWSPRAIRQMSVYVKPIIEKRLQMLRDYGDDWTDKPNDFLMWLTEEAFNVGQTVDLIVQGILLSNFAAIHTSSNSITHALYYLAANPQYMQPLREEIESIVKENGWNKAAIGKMWKLDSFMRESQRLNGIVAISVMRKVLQDVTLSDGTYLPPGTIIAGAALATHRDEKNYENAQEFQPFRFSDMRGEEGERIKHQFVSTSPDYVPFGHGKHACPGRFFAANELKAMMAYILMNFDLKFEGGKERPQNRTVWHSIVPEPAARVMFRKRQEVSA